MGCRLLLGREIAFATQWQMGCDCSVCCACSCTTFVSEWYSRGGSWCIQSAPISRLKRYVLMEWLTAIITGTGEQTHLQAMHLYVRGYMLAMWVNQYWNRLKALYLRGLSHTRDGPRKAWCQQWRLLLKTVWVCEELPSIMECLRAHSVIVLAVVSCLEPKVAKIPIWVLNTKSS